MKPDRAKIALQGHRVRLRLVEATDYAALRRLELGSDLGLRWRHSGQHVAPEDYGASLWDGVLSAYIFESVGEERVAGIVSAYSADPRHGFCYVALARLQSSANAWADAAAVTEALSLFVDFLFQGWNFRKLIFEVAGYNRQQFGKFLRQLSQEANYKDHLFLDGIWWNLEAFALWRERWPDVRNHLIRRLDNGR